jgi:hypothetical protein
MLQRRLMHRFGGRLGLFALGLQFALAFAHIHASDIYRFGHPVVQGRGAIEFVAPSKTAPAAPGQSPTLHLDCAICASMALAGSLLPAEPPALAPPSVSRTEAARGDRALALAAPPYLLFQTRAPPSA